MSTHPNSWNSWLSTFELGERRYLETTLEDYASTMRTVCTPLTRRPAAIKEWEFTASLFTAVSAKPAGVIRYLICVERTK